MRSKWSASQVSLLSKAGKVHLPRDKYCEFILISTTVDF